MYAVESRGPLLAVVNTVHMEDGLANGDGVVKRHVFTTYFVPLYAKRRSNEGSFVYNFANQRSYASLDVMQLEILLVPLHVSDSHWVAAAIAFLDRKFISMDSMRGSDST